jgi:peptidoglycan-associated lipoprotein
MVSSCATTKEEPTTEVAPTAEELEKEQMEELDRLEQEELEALKRDETLQEEVRDMTFEESELNTVYFGFDQYLLTSRTKETLEKNAEIINLDPLSQIQIEGHCDERGTEEYNLALGEKRATAAKSYLVSLGIEDSRIYTISYGEERPEEPGHTEDAWSKNRRAIFRVTSQ